MFVKQEFSDYGSGSSLESWKSWGDCDYDRVRMSDDVRPRQIQRPKPLRPIHKASSFQEGSYVATRNSLDAMQEFRMNGLDSPYDPEENRWSRQTDNLIGPGQASVYLRQKSWPDPDSSPAPRLPRPADAWLSDSHMHKDLVHEVSAPELPQSTPREDNDTITPDQVRVLNSLPNNVLYSLLKELEQDRSLGTERRKSRRPSEECRFCKNNGERESYYRSHALKDPAGRVSCPVLRAFVCGRCGARGDTAHTVKYCPMTTADERIKSAAMMRSVRMASGRRRNTTPSTGNFVLCGETSPSFIQDGNTFNLFEGRTVPLDPLWAALEQKLSL